MPSLTRRVSVARYTDSERALMRIRVAAVFLHEVCSQSRLNVDQDNKDLAHLP